MPISCRFQGCTALLRTSKRRYIKYHAFAFLPLEARVLKNKVFLSSGTRLPSSLRVQASDKYYRHCQTRMKRQLYHIPHYATISYAYIHNNKQKLWEDIDIGVTRFMILEICRLSLSCTVLFHHHHVSSLLSFSPLPSSPSNALSS